MSAEIVDTEVSAISTFELTRSLATLLALMGGAISAQGVLTSTRSYAPLSLLVLLCAALVYHRANVRLRAELVRAAVARGASEAEARESARNSLRSMRHRRRA